MFDLWGFELSVRHLILVGDPEPASALRQGRTKQHPPRCLECHPSHRCCNCCAPLSQLGGWPSVSRSKMNDQVDPIHGRDWGTVRL